ncbi:hydantoinase/oxoprolinase family protein [Halalkaliarchaeum sp. AArc-GB]|uniref:hydantoinase/oxoprolinase family protein n=1 Tax=Halalkaliarchaeum sp. AArc-GB TaxID=3074078 RepID=UPI00285BBAA7|nr:hydantoinase/oxoprolinase family protein [Halalkaliarchaeum sp. AArc-GB]MDR5674496.1 hydantoinase/oxoprolinase family protein [Halalkaliarchaeum sp. AArc-GB]
MTETTTAVGVDVGGTFTDVALLVEGQLVTAKVPTTDDQSAGVLDGIRKACKEAGIEPGTVEEFVHAMTVSVNALLERDGARTALVTTAGFRDVLEIGRQDRPSLYDLDVEKPTPIVPRRRRFEIDERATAEGIERPVDADEVRDVAARIDDAGAESVAVCLLHAYAHPENEREIARILRAELEVSVSVSHEVLAEFREFERTATTAVDAYVRPAIDGYVGRLTERATAAGLPSPQIMQANGGIADAETVRNHAVTTVLSGPAAGVVGAAATAECDGLVTFDMGGTSTDVSLVRDGSAERTTDAEIDGIPIRTPMVDVNTVGAGGGSIAWVDEGGALRVGPRSAGANPGPACYGRGGSEPTVTDANVVLGYVGPETALGGELTLDVDAAKAALSELADRAGLPDAREAARGVYRVANATMTRAIRAVTVERGHDPRRFGLVAFGGAGPMHAAALADALDIERVTVPKPAGVLSAFGLLAADESHDAARTIKTEIVDADADRIESVYEELREEALADVSNPDRARLERAIDCRYSGQSFELTVPVGETFDPEMVTDRFHEAHETAYGYALEETVEGVTLRTTATVTRETPTVRHAGGEGDPVLGTRPAYFPESGERDATVFDRGAVAAGTVVDGPAILEQAESTTVVPPDWRGTVTEDGALRMEAVA